jgi:DNA-binding CsgD family transcriptional regulator
MKAKGYSLTKEEKDVLILAAPHPCGQHLTITEIGQCLGISATRVKTLIHQACAKLGAHNRYEAIFFAVRRGKIKPDEFYSLDELAEIFTTLQPDMFRNIRRLSYEEIDAKHFSGKDEQIIHTGRRRNNILTERERDVLILAGRGFTNREIAGTLYISIHAVSTFLYRACNKLGTHNRAGAVVLALKRGEICIADVYSLKDFVQVFTTLGAESLEKIAELMARKIGQNSLPTGR